MSADRLTPFPKPRCLEDVLEIVLTAFVDAWENGRYDDATVHAKGTDAALNFLADRLGITSPEDRRAFLGGELG